MDVRDLDIDLIDRINPFDAAYAVLAKAMNRVASRCSQPIMCWWKPWTLLRYRIRRYAAERFWEGLRAGVAAIEPVGEADLEAAWHMGVAFPGQDFSLVDRTSFAVMRRLGMERVASLDNHFAVFRFGPNHRHAFTVVR
jgi:predicted nucleic acid-binding protein